MSMLGGLESPGINSLGGSKNEPLGGMASAQGGVVPQVPPRRHVSEYKLTWNNYSLSIASFIRLISPQEGLDCLSDVTVTCPGGKYFKAHRLVLATCSTYFRNIFFTSDRGFPGEEGTCVGYPIVVIPDIQSQVLQLILAFMYTGDITVPSHLILPLMEAGRMLGVQGLTEPMHDQPATAQPSSNINNLQSQQGPPLQQHQPSTPTPPTTSSQPNNIQQPNTTSTTLQSQILQAFSQPFLKDSAQDVSRKRALPDCLLDHQEPQDLSKKTPKLHENNEQQYTQPPPPNTDHIIPSGEENDQSPRKVDGRIFCFKTAMMARESKPISHHRRKSSPTRYVKTSPVKNGLKDSVIKFTGINKEPNNQVQNHNSSPQTTSQTISTTKPILSSNPSSQTEVSPEPNADKTCVSPPPVSAAGNGSTDVAAAVGSNISPKDLTKDQQTKHYEGISLAAVAAAATTMASLATSTTTTLYPGGNGTGSTAAGGDSSGVTKEDPSRPFACAVCPKRFRMKHHLKEHSLIHSGEMPYSCHLCPKRFNRSYTLKNHMKLHNSSNARNNQEQTSALALTKRSKSS
eukprot:TRINITY_DN1818_c0_g1_i4.p1 TRINITY_DN1818_c0_g1~~TRINITY_DN1818_c0_g1_i4.p1  ORF type:complete len:572 (-),score=122.22 TRINITY_DN1818_c0_g1_i4:29-1744(-)